MQNTSAAVRQEAAVENLREALRDSLNRLGASNEPQTMGHVIARVVEYDEWRERDLGLFTFVALPRPNELVSLTPKDGRREEICQVIGTCHIPAPVDEAKATSPVMEPTVRISVRHQHFADRG